MEMYTKKAKEGEMIMYAEVLNIIADQYNKISSVLILPKSLSVDSNEHLLTLPFYEGETFNSKWDESNGGAPLGLDLSSEVPLLIKDLSQIDIYFVVDNPKVMSIPNLVFDHKLYVLDFEEKMQKFISKGLISKTQANTARIIMQISPTSSPIFNNGDFYPRNFIRTPENKIIIIDWEPWNANSRANIIDYPENVAALCFVHMWGNSLWQDNYVSELRKLFSFTQQDFQRAILIKSLELASFWFEKDELCKNQIRLFVNALDEKYMESLWK